MTDNLADAIERILFRRALEHRLEGYTLETAQELADLVRTLLPHDLGASHD